MEESLQEQELEFLGMALVQQLVLGQPALAEVQLEAEAQLEAEELHIHKMEESLQEQELEFLGMALVQHLEQEQ
jgi:hypothetical protein